MWLEKIDGERGHIDEGDTVMSWLEKMPKMVGKLRRLEFDSIVVTHMRLSTWHFGLCKKLITSSFIIVSSFVFHKYAD